MAIDPPSTFPASSRHRWTFFRAGGFDQVRLETGADLMALEQLDQKLWVALSCPTGGLEFDGKTLEMIDSDGDGRIRVPEIIAAVKWLGSVLKNPDELTRRAAALPLSSINDQTPEGKQLLDSAKHILANLGKADAKEITLDDAAGTAMILAQTRFNGDGVIPADAADDAAVGQVIADIIECLGPDEDRSGKPGITQEKTDRFFAEAQAFSDWQQEAETGAAAILPLGEATSSAVAAFLTVRDKMDDYFTRCRLAAFDLRALGALNRQEAEYIAIADKNLFPSLKELLDFPLAQVQVRGALPLKEGVNPAWIEAVKALDAGVVRPLLGHKEAITEEEWAHVNAVFLPHNDWLSKKAGAAVEKLGIGRVREILDSDVQDIITALIARDKSLEPEFNNVASVEKLVRCYRGFFTLLNNFVSFSDFYARKDKAVFQAGTLYLDGRSCDLCVRVGDMDKHAALATLSRIYLTYCNCTRRGGTDKMTIAAAITGGDSDFLMAGRNGVFYDRQGNDWDATIVKVIEHPISIRQAFWSPYKRIAKMIGNQLSKLAAARDKAVTDKAAAGIAQTGTKLDEGKAPAPAFDVGKFAGIFAAIGLALGAIGTALAAVVTGILKLPWWQMPLVLGGLVLIISGPSMIIAWLKLRQRNLAPILDAGGWAVNARVRINVAFGGSLTKIASLPEGAVRKLEDPFADKKIPWPKLIILTAILLVLFYMLYRLGLINQWLSCLIG
ncbi:MAG: hypothetical protein C0394_02940 [Syntrophus sp. (in: bacteria)]|nr:hypothetical protein [Syntrophus sp. (in: bacteria)]